jgi:flagellar basal body-associated protein FliL
MGMKKIIMFGGVALVLAAGLGAGAYLFLPKLKGGSEHEPENSETEHEVEAPKPVAPPPKQQAAPPPAAHDDEDDEATLVSVKLPPFVLNLPASAGARSPFFKCTLSIVLRDEEFGKVMASDASYQFQKAQSIVLDALTALVANPDDLLVNETKEVFCDDLTDRLNEEIKRPKPGEGGGGGGHGEKKPDKNAKQPPTRPFKEVMILEWATQR